MSGEKVLNEELKLSAYPVQTDIISRRTVEIRSYTTDKDGTLEFEVENKIDNFFLDQYNIILRLDLALEKVGTPNETATADVTKAYPVNNLIHSLFSNINVALNDQVITHNDKTYPYMAYLSTLLQECPEESDSFGYARRWVKDEFNAMEPGIIRKAEGEYDTTGAGTTYKKINRPASAGGKRFARFFHGGRPKITRFEDRLMVIPFTQNKLLPFGMRLKIELERSNIQFYMMNSDKTAAIYDVVVKDVLLLVPFVELNHEVFARFQADKSIAGYKERRIPINRTRVISVNLSPGMNYFPISNVFIHQILPKRIFLAMVPNNATRGDYAQNPFNFKHFTLEHLQLQKGTRMYPACPLTPDLAKGEYLSCYRQFQDATNLEQSGSGTNVTYKEFGQGFTIFGFDLTADMALEGAAKHIQTFGNLSIDIKFNETSPGISPLVFAEYDGKIILDNTDNVRVTWDG